MATENNIRSELKQISPQLAGLPSDTPYHLPKGYFDDLEKQVMLRISTENAGTPAEEVNILSPVLATLKNKPTFTMPPGYLDTLRAKTLEAVKEPQGAIVVHMFRRNIFKYAAAAVLIGIIGTAAWVFNFNKNDNSANSLSNNQVAVEKQIQSQANSVSDKEMINYLQANLSTPTLEAVSGTEDINQDDIQLLLADISDKELEQYLDRNDPRAEKFN